MQATGTVLSWLTGSAAVGMLIVFVPFVRSNTIPRTHPYVPLAYFVSSVAPFLGVIILAAETVALVLLVVGVVRWPSRIIRSPRWVLSAIGIVLVAASILVVAAVAATIAVQNP